MNTVIREYLPTAITSDNYPIHKWFNFVAGYSPEYVRMVINEYISTHGQKPHKIYDPFSGCATTCVVANEFDIPSIGVERNPFFYKIGYTKANASIAITELSSIIFDFKKTIDSDIDSDYINSLSASAKEYLLKLFDDTSLEKLLAIRALVNQYNGIKHYMAYTLLSKMMEFVTSAKVDGIYRVPTSSKKPLDVYSALIRASSIISEGFDSVIKTSCKSSMIFDSSISYALDPKSVDLVIFSPPYLNNFDFAEMTRMQLYFWGDASNWSEISEKHRNHMLVNTTTALKPFRTITQQMSLRDSLPQQLLSQIDPIVNRLNQFRKEENKKKTYDLIIYPYLSQMKDVLEHCFNALKDNGEIHIVLSDAAFYGIHIDTQEYIKIILDCIGFKNSRIELMRTRGERWILDKRKNSGKQLGEYEIIAQKR